MAYARGIRRTKRKISRPFGQLEIPGVCFNYGRMNISMFAVDVVVVFAIVVFVIFIVIVVVVSGGIRDPSRRHYCSTKPFHS